MRVLELASVLAGPSVGQFLAELGADVIKVENPRTEGDVTRGWLLPGEDRSSAGDKPSAYFRCCNLGKRSVALDAASVEGSRLCRKLAAASDVVLASYKPGDAEKFGLDAATLRDVSPRIVYAQVTGYGLDDARVGYDALIQAEAGFTYMNGEPGPAGQPTKMPVALVDLLAAHQLKEAILLALWQRDRTGQGAHLSVSLMAAAVSSLANQATGYLCAGAVPQRMGSEHPAITPYGGAFSDSSGRQLVLAVGSEAQFAALCDVIGDPALARDPRFSTNAARVEHREVLRTRLSELICAHGRDELLVELAKRKVPAGAIADMRSVFRTPQAQSLVVRGPGADPEGLRQVAWRVEGTGGGAHQLRRAPAYGEHTAEVLQELLGHDGEDVAKLAADGIAVVRTSTPTPGQ